MRSRNTATFLDGAGLVVLRSGKGSALQATPRRPVSSRGRYKPRPTASEADAQFSFHGYGNGVEFGASLLRWLVDCHEDVRNHAGRSMFDEKAAVTWCRRNGAVGSTAGRAEEPRCDARHHIARAGTDASAFESAIRDFLAHQFSGHRYAVHDPTNDPKEAGERPHVHAHAIIAMFRRPVQFTLDYSLFEDPDARKSPRPTHVSFQRSSGAQRRDLNPDLSSSTKIVGCSHAAK
jgi:hypothetical protein